MKFSVLMSIYHKEKIKDFRIIDFPIYDCFEDKFSISLNFDRLRIGRADYSYNNRNVEVDF